MPAPLPPIYGRAQIGRRHPARCHKSAMKPSQSIRRTEARAGPGATGILPGVLPVNRTIGALPSAALLSACGSNGGGSAGSANDIRIVGSSTVYPFTKAVAEEFMRANPGLNVTVESTGTGGGMKLFCAGVGSQFPDIEDASRQIKKSEYDTCVKNGAKSIVEVAVGIDGLTIIESTKGPGMNLTQADIYKALAENPFGK